MTVERKENPTGREFFDEMIADLKSKNDELKKKDDLIIAYQNVLNHIIERLNFYESIQLMPIPQGKREVWIS